jgi:regulation of enolase protein 1 (concanavalin A-like superfamily)
VSPERHLTLAPGALKRDATILPRSGGGTVPVAPADGWTGRDIGFVALAGSSGASGGTVTLRASGADIWHAADGFHFWSRRLSGDVEILARVAALQAADPWAKAGVMIRETSAAGSRHASLFATPGRGVAFQRRLATGGASTHTAAGSGVAPQWVRLVRIGSSISAYRSATGADWSLVGSDQIGMARDVDVGLALTSHDNAALAQAGFDGLAWRQLLPAGWSSRDIGATVPAGGAFHSAGTFGVRGAGADIWGTADGFHFLYRAWTGDGDIVARVTGLEPTHAWAKAGVMFRESLTAGSRHAFMLVSAGKGTAFQRRTSTSGISTHTGGTAAGAPRWVRLVRRGQTVTAYESADGSSWAAVGSDTVSMGATVYVGLAVTSHSDGRPAAATFDRVAIR